MGGGATGERRDGRWRRWAGGLAQLALLLAVVYFTGRLLSDVGLHQLGDRIREAAPALLLAATGALFARFVVWDVRWRLAFRELDATPGVAQSFFSLLGAVFVNLVTPSARIFGGLLRARYVSRSGERSFGRVYGVVLFDQVAHQVVVVITTCLALVGMAALLQIWWLAVSTAVVLVAAATVFSLWTQGRLGRRAPASGCDEEPPAAGLDPATPPPGEDDLAGNGGFVGWLARVAARQIERGGRAGSVYREGAEALRAIRFLLGCERLRRWAILLGLGFVLLNALAQWLVFLSLDFRVSMLAVLIGVTLGTAAGALTGTPGGLGTTEAGMIFTFVALEVPEVEAVAATVLYRGLHYLLVVALGLPALLAFEARHRRAKRRRRRGEEPREAAREEEP
jgi:uncharacterized membrane protein YbhN (UPF0104 family)